MCMIMFTVPHYLPVRIQDFILLSNCHTWLVLNTIALVLRRFYGRISCKMLWHLDVFVLRVEIRKSAGCHQHIVVSVLEYPCWMRSWTAQFFYVISLLVASVSLCHIIHHINCFAWLHHVFVHCVHKLMKIEVTITLKMLPLLFPYNMLMLSWVTSHEWVRLFSVLNWYCEFIFKVAEQFFWRDALNKKRVNEGLFISKFVCIKTLWVFDSICMFPI